MKKIRLISILLLCALLFTGCSLGEQPEYATKEDLEALKDVQSSEAGDSYNVNISASENSSLLGASKALLSVVSISCNFEELFSSGWYGSQQTGLRTTTYYGSGVIYKMDKSKGDAYIITNYHVVYNSSSVEKNHISKDISLFLYGQENEADAIKATYVGGSAYYDIAVLKVSSSSILKQSIAAAATFANSDKVSVLDTAIAIGNPAGMGISATAGYVSVDSEEIVLQVTNGYVNMRVMRVDTAVNGGNSGGGLFDENGNLIGIVNAKISDYSIENIAYAIPSNVARHLADSILSSDKGVATRCILGVVPKVVSSKAVYDTETGKISILETVGIESIADDSAAKGKLLVDDVIRKLTIDGNETEVKREFQLRESMFAARVGSTVVFEILRNGETLNVSFTITENMVTEF